LHRIWIANVKYQDWKQVERRASSDLGFYGYEIVFMPEFFKEMREWEMSPPQPASAGAAR
jgi:hypothetical protein